MDGLADLREITRQADTNDRIKGAIAEVTLLIGESSAQLEKELVRAYETAPGDVLHAVHHMISAGGKRIRPLVCLLSHRAVNGSGEPPVDMGVACELLHNATLLHDDVIDEGQVRRGEPTARLLYGNAISVLGGDFLLIQTVDMVSKRDPEMMVPFVSTLQQLIHGELAQLKLRGSTKTTESQYFDIIEGKTASLFKWAATAGAIAGGTNKENVDALANYGWNVGTAFQLMDDSLDFVADGDKLGKSLLADINEGKMTLPVILTAQRSPELQELLNRLGQNGSSAEIAMRIAEIVRENGALSEVRRRAAKHTERAVAALDAAAGLSPQIVALLTELARGLLDREA